MSTTATLTLRKIDCLDDPNLYAWLDLYESSFPPEQRVPVSVHLRTIQSRMQADENQAWCISADCDGQFVGMAQVAWFPEEQTAYLGYLAVRPDLQGQGLGSLLYHRLLDDLSAYQARLLLFDVECPTMSRRDEDRDLDWRRIRFYQRMGVGLLRGLYYSWGELPLLQYLMAHPLAANLSTEDVLISARKVITTFGSTLIPEPGYPRVELVFF